MSLIINKDIQLRVSSVLNRNNQLYGSKNLIDNLSDTAWNSDQGENQWITVKFNEKVSSRCMKIQFQGGFSALELNIEFIDYKNQKVLLSQNFELIDTNKEQSIELKNDIEYDFIRMNFSHLCDMFGRLIVYKLDFLK